MAGWSKPRQCETSATCAAWGVAQRSEEPQSWIVLKKCTLVRSPLSQRQEGDAGTLAGEKGDGDEEEDSDGNGKEKGARRDRRSRDRCVPAPALLQPSLDQPSNMGGTACRRAASQLLALL